MIYLIYLFFGLAPSIVWLLFFLRKDAHPESNRMVLRIFLYGVLIALPALFVEIGLSQTFSKIPLSKSIIAILNIFLGVAFIEEFFKYLVVREKVLKDPELDEPIDLILYMIISALGFAAVENILVLFLLEKPFLIGEVSFITAFRFVGATFLHALSSGTLGYFLIRYFSRASKKTLISGFLLATLLHGFFNFSIIMADEGKITKEAGFFLIGLLLIFWAGFLNISFKKVKKLPSVCYIK